MSTASGETLERVHGRPDLRSDRRNQRVGDARDHDEGQGAEGSRRARDRVRRGRTRLRDAQHIVEAAIAACSDPANHKYTPASGLPDLRKAIAAKTMRDSGFACEPRTSSSPTAASTPWPTASPSARPGDEVLVPTPYWTTYPEPIALAGGVTVPVLATVEHGFRASLDQLEAARTDKTKALLFVSPSNPTGAMYSRDEIEAIGKWAVDTISGSSPTRSTSTSSTATTSITACRLSSPRLADKCVVLNGVAKTYAMTGWRVGWMIGPTDVIKAAPTCNRTSRAT